MWERMTMILMICMLAVSIMLNFTNAGFGIDVTSGNSTSSLNTTSMITKMNSSIAKFTVGAASASLISFLVVGIPSLIDLSFGLLGYIVVVPLDYQNFFNFLSGLVETGASGPIHTLFSMFTLCVIVLYYYGLFNIIKDIARIIRGAGG